MLEILLIRLVLGICVVMEDFDLKINRNEVIRSGLASYQFDVQLAGSARATARRVEGLYDDVINEQAVPITVKDYLDNPDAYVPLITQRIFDTLEAAEAYANIIGIVLV
jgi:hypothetical protein